MSLAARAEVLKLARELHTDVDELAFLERADEDDIALLRERLHDSLYERHRPVFRRLEHASRLLPNTITARIATSYFGPMLSGKVVTELSPERAMKLLPHIDQDFLAESCLYLDPKTAGPLLQALPLDVIRPTLHELLDRDEHITVGRFIGAISEDKLLAVVAEIDDERDLILVGFFAEDKDRIDVVLRSLPDERAERLLRVALDDDLFVEALSLMEHVSEQTRARLADMMASLGTDALHQVVAVTVAEDAWADLVPVFVSMTPEHQQQGADVIAEHGDTSIRAVIAAAEASGHGQAVGVERLREHATTT